ncbi:DUF4344 domain-containing metallopeptidase [Desulfovibrio subterraneus]|uniref:Metallopeptidase DUF4344 n=1 Tax=Desulfovibrio subterraneus TaxID=2718620 RepID=A0A7J0BKZ8_9BACT|nr:DUF4344 domain-containing metallopeptidase [Desulfovibrio subterraneus]WBF68464.1 DUF4344 domain-containing metallopeptidase [Desulfovibrio subterraneus]GFM34423.1 hypothetical protein DSM101010T_27880 [Desulfovibrio subterraneus]
MRPVARSFLLLVLLLALHRPASAAGKVSLAYEPASKEDVEIAEMLIESHIGDDVARVINVLNCLPRNVVIRFGTEEGPQYAPAMKGRPAEIHFPYAFVSELRRIFTRNGYTDSPQALERATLDAVQHTLFHELGHAIISMRGIPTDGGEEDAVDSLATILLIESFENGGDIALSAADSFSFLAREEEIDMSVPQGDVPDDKFGTLQPNIAAALDEHSLNVHRYEAIACLIYGSNPDRYDFIAQDLQLSKQDASSCVENYDKQSEYWFSLLQR